MLSNVSGVLKLTGVLLLAALLPAGVVPACRPLTRCNLHVSLCDKAYDEVSRGAGPTAMEYVSSLGSEAPLVPDRELLAAA